MFIHFYNIVTYRTLSQEVFASRAANSPPKPEMTLKRRRRHQHLWAREAREIRGIQMRYSINASQMAKVRRWHPGKIRSSSGVFRLMAWYYRRESFSQLLHD
jgi:dTDP-D-glucose 4,6-dehydratase